jgi:hypothetical protein
VDTFLVNKLLAQQNGDKGSQPEQQQETNTTLESCGGKTMEATPNPHQPLGELSQQPSTQKKKPKGSGQFSLKTLAKVYLGRSIQQGKRGHDSVEDAIATRDIASWNVVKSLQDDKEH